MNVAQAWYGFSLRYPLVSGWDCMESGWNHFIYASDRSGYSLNYWHYCPVPSNICSEMGIFSWVSPQNCYIAYYGGV
jgi:hypothetical protein